MGRKNKSEMFQASIVVVLTVCALSSSLVLVVRFLGGDTSAL